MEIDSAVAEAAQLQAKVGRQQTRLHPTDRHSPPKFPPPETRTPVNFLFRCWDREDRNSHKLYIPVLEGEMVQWSETEKDHNSHHDPPAQP